jgi:hypothetical protein
MLIETFMRKQLGLKAHTVTRVEETDEYMIVHIDRLGGRLLRCGVFRQRCRKVHSVRKAREWRDLSMAEIAIEAALPPSSGRMSAMRLAGGGFSLGGTVGAGDHVFVECGSEPGSGPELAGNGPSLRVELEERGDRRRAGSGVWAAPPEAPAGACRRHR